MGRLAAAGVAALAALLFFARLGARSLWHSEFLWAEIAREMQLTHDYFWPAIIGRVYYDTPLVSYWLILAASWVTGRLNEAACRTPSALAVACNSVAHYRLAPGVAGSPASDIA